MGIELPDSVENRIYSTVPSGRPFTDFAVYKERKLGRRRYALAGRHFQVLYLDDIVNSQHRIVDQSDNVLVEDVLLLVRETLETPERVLERIVAELVAER